MSDQTHHLVWREMIFRIFFFKKGITRADESPFSFNVNILIEPFVDFNLEPY